MSARAALRTPAFQADRPIVPTSVCDHFQQALLRQSPVARASTPTAGNSYRASGSRQLHNMPMPK
jgi:hypothetical protein